MTDRYRTGDRVMASRIETEPRFSASVPETLFEGVFLSTTMFERSTRTYDVSADGQSFLMIERDEDANTELHIVLNWLEELETRVPGAR